jgi:excinuclease ABC subunit A
LSVENIVIKGAREHNLKNINLTIPRDKLIVMTGISGSGKSSLAFDTIYADGQRRYMESLSSYARQFLGQMEKPDVDSIEGLSPAVSIDQKTSSKNPRSTVGTVTEIFDYLRLLYSRIGIPHCPICKREVKNQTVEQIVDEIMQLEKGTRFQVLAPVVSGRKGEHKNEIASALKSGFVRARVDGEILYLSEEISLDKNRKHNIEIIVDRLVIDDDIVSRLHDSIETSLSLSGDAVIIDVIDGDEIVFSRNYACPEHGSVNIGDMAPRMFSFNNPFGACETCTGLGSYQKVDADLIIPNTSLSIKEGGIKAPGWTYSDGSIAKMYIDSIAAGYGFDADTPIKDIPKAGLDAILYGTKGKKFEFRRENEFGLRTFKGSFEGIITNLERRYKETTSDWSKNEISAFMSDELCPSCKGKRLNPTSLAVTVNELGIMQLSDYSVSELVEIFDDFKLTGKDAIIGEGIIKEIKERLGFLNNVGLEYLTLSRASSTLSGGESQRIRLASQIGSSLVGVLYVLDEPSIGLHQKDNRKLIEALKKLRDIGNTLIVVEHDEEMIRSADYIVDIGPGAGVHGGEIVCTGSISEIEKCQKSVTGNYLSGRMSIEIPKVRRKGNGKQLVVYGAAQNNLKNIDVSFPLGTFTCVTGVSGSGKSSLVNEILFKKLSADLNRARSRPGRFRDISGLEHLDKVIGIDQSPIGRTPRSNPATYTGVFTFIRELFASTNEAKLRGYGQGRFSFNIKGGRCEACQGDGLIKIEMHFLPDIYVPCEVCKGRRYNRETLEVKYKGKSIYDVLEMTVVEAMNFFENNPRIYSKLKTIFDVGLGYIKLGQSSTTLSGGEAQRTKLSLELSKRSTGKSIYILDEPTTGLHSADVHKLIDVLQKLVDNGNTVIIIEHNLDVIKTADYIIDLGPDGGDRGGHVIATGTPEEVSRCEKSYTGTFLKRYWK